MKRNMGTIDRALRLSLAVVVAILFFTGRIDGLAATVLGVLAVVFFLTSLAGSCPLYSVVGLSTSGTAEDS